jgi:hypothetical protein
MKKMGCEHESSVIRALHSDEWTNELRVHVAECQDCSQALYLAGALREEAKRAEIHCNPPNPHWIMQRSRRMAREIAMKRMAQVLAVTRTVAAFYVVAVIAWVLRGYAESQYREVASAMHGTSSWFALTGAMVAAVCVLAGLWPILREGSELRGR